MSQQGALRDYIRNIAANSTDDVYAAGDFVRLANAEGGTVTVATDNGDSFELGEGQSARVRSRFSTLRVTNDSGVKRRVHLVVGIGDFRSQQVSGEVAPKPAGTIQAVGDYVGGDTIPGNAERRQLVMRASLDNAMAVTIAGLPIEPGDSFELDVTGAVAVGGDPADVLHVAEVV